MKVHLAFNHPGENHAYQKKLWKTAIVRKGYREHLFSDCEVVVTWGINREYYQALAAKIPVLMIDFPYWNRSKDKNGLEYYKVSLNGQHPTPYVMSENRSSQRYQMTAGARIQPWRDEGEYILLAGMGHKAAKQYGYGYGEWEKMAVREIRKHTNKPIVYRTKPKQTAMSIPGARSDDGSMPIESVLEKADCLVCYHGNATVSAIQMGIPVFMKEGIGAASHCAANGFDVRTKVKPETREKLLYNLAHWQFSAEEIKTGRVFESFLSRGFL